MCAAGKAPLASCHVHTRLTRVVFLYRLMEDKETRQPKGYGFCEYKDEASAMSAVRNLNGYEVNGRQLRVDWSQGGDNQNRPGGGRANDRGNDRDRKGGSSSSRDNGRGPGSSAASCNQLVEAAVAKVDPSELFDILAHAKVPPPCCACCAPPPQFGAIVS